MLTLANKNGKNRNIGVETISTQKKLVNLIITKNLQVTQ